MTMYCFYQTESGGKWHTALATERENLVAAKGAKLITALDVDNDFSETMTQAEYADVKYVGDLFFDFDDETVEASIENFKRFLTKLKAMNVNLDQCRTYATGGRGFHFFIPMKMFLTDSAKAGIAGLVHTYKEMAKTLFVDGMDLRVYSAKKGRQLRCSNVQRENLLHKVQITSSDAMNMTGELFKVMCAAPRPAFAPEPAEFNADLALLYAQSRDKIVKALAAQRKRKPAPDVLLKFREKKEWPEAVFNLLNGVGVNPSAGWNQISLQLALIAAQLGFDDKKLLEDAEVLLREHKGDSGRYGNYRARKSDLRQMWGYISESPCYEFSLGGFLSIVAPEFRGNVDIAQGDFVPDKPKQKAPTITDKVEVASGDEPEADEVPDAEDTDDDDDDVDERYPVRLSTQGIFVRTEAGYASVAELGLTSPEMVFTLDNEDVQGFIVDVHSSGIPKGRHMLPMSAISSKASLNAWAGKWGVGMRASDNQVSYVRDILRGHAVKQKSIVYTTMREGLDIVKVPGDNTDDNTDVIWVSDGATYSSKGIKYQLRSNLGNMVFRSDLLSAPKLEESDKHIITSMLNMNTTKNTALLLGWFVAAFMCQHFRQKFDRFPSLQVFGQAGAGKSTTAKLLMHLHYYKNKPQILASSGNTAFAIKSFVTGSASIPIIFDEFKPREMNKQVKDALHNVFRTNYDGSTMASGTVSKDGSNREVDLVSPVNVAPIAFIGEAIDDQAAILERCVIVPLSKADQQSTVNVMEMQKDSYKLGKLGRHILNNALYVDGEKLYEGINETMAILHEVIKNTPTAQQVPERCIFNQSVVLEGLKLLKITLREVFGDEFNDRMEELCAAMIENVHSNIPRNISEAAKVLDTLAMLSHSLDPNFRMEHGIDYLRSDDGQYIELKMKTSFAKYVRYQRSLGYEVLFDTDTAFITGMGKYAGTAAKASPGSKLADTPLTMIYKLSVPYLEKEGIEMFK